MNGKSTHRWRSECVSNAAQKGKAGMISDSFAFRQALGEMGISPAAIDAVWPGWWSDEAERSPSAQAELRFAVARRLGLAPSTLFDEQPRFLWEQDANFKGPEAPDDLEKAAITSFGIALSRTLVSMTPEGQISTLLEQVLAQLRDQILRTGDLVDLRSLCKLGWGLGIPIVHLRAFPLSAKRMAAMAVRVGDRYAILIGRDAVFPAPIAYHLAHVLGHVALGHLDDLHAIVDTDKHDSGFKRDETEAAADRFAFELLTGSAEPVFEVDAKPRNGAELATAAIGSSARARTESGTICLCYGRMTGDWAIANAALDSVYRKKSEVWKVVNGVARQHLNSEDLSEDTEAYVSAVLGAPDIA